MTLNESTARRQMRPVRRVAGLALSILAMLAISPAMAQVRDGGLGRRATPQPRLEEPEFAPESAPRLQLPAVPAPPQEFEATGSLFVRQVLLTGVENPVLSEDEIAAITGPYLSREVSLEELFLLKDEITLAYVRKGHVSSGAVLPDQDVSDGVVRFEIVEGDLEEVRVTGTRWLDPDFIAARLRRGVTKPLKRGDLETQAQLLLLEPSIAKLEVELAPGTVPGGSVLEARLEESPRLRTEVRFANDRSPSVGSTGPELAFTFDNVFGRLDPLELTFGVTEGVREVNARYSVPLTPGDLRLHLEGEISNSDVIDDDVEDLSIETSSKKLVVGLTAPLYETVAQRLDADISFERRESQGTLLGEPFSFAKGSSRGETDLSLLSGQLTWRERSPERALILVGTVTAGLDVLDATESKTGHDAQFVIYEAQGQYVQRLFSEDDQLVLKGEIQLTPNPLPSPMLFGLGGIDSVRGYRVDEIVRDQGWFASIEYRGPLWSFPVAVPEREDAVSTLQWAVFTDLGQGFDDSGRNEELQASIGPGLIWSWPSFFRAELYVGLPLTERTISADDFFQDAGIGFRFTAFF